MPLTNNTIFVAASPLTMSGREGLVETDVKTATSGYIQRCMVKATEEMTAMYDGTIRDAQSSVVQFV